jgi:surfeit locus 1 family protein
MLPSVATALLLPVLITLGSWQLGKYHAKLARQAEFDQRSRAAVVELAPHLADAEAFRFRHVALRGRYDAGHQFLLDNRVHHEQAGYHVLTPLRLEGSDAVVLVNRGWIAASAEHRVPPQVATPAGPVELRGVATVPSPRIYALAPEPAGWHPVWQNLDLQAWGRATGVTPLPLVIQLDADSATGFAREWPRPDERMAQNLSYAFQWYGFAAALAGFWSVASLRRVSA